jgi:hypothetical protein
LQSSLSFARKCLIAAQQRQKALADKRRVDQVYKVGDKVLLSTRYLNLKHSETSRKLLPKWIGPLEVVQVVGPVAYKLKINPGWRVHPVSVIACEMRACLSKGIMRENACMFGHDAKMRVKCAKNAYVEFRV